MSLSQINRIVLVVAATMILAAGGRAQSAGLSAPLVLRSQASSIAEESFGKLGTPDGATQLGLVVSGGTARAIVENAFLDFFGRKGIRISLPSVDTGARNQLQLTILDQSVRYSVLAGGDYRRDIQTAIEARHTSNDSSSVQYIGLFRRQAVDTVAFREDGGSTAADQPGERTLMDRLLSPILLIGGAFLIVYLFFTVRN
ncbi:MAG TPA: hypothetical protein VMH23_18705 [Bacteroidota bacterium]|nr:hypothetical protein [Bacteroidota bacterium]